ncbi:MAG: N-6 DNA methylase, partial [Nitrosopumilus sp.]
KDGYRERKNEILFIDASKMGEMATRRLRVFSDEDIQKIAGVYNEWRKTEGKHEDVPGFCKAATVEDVKTQDYKLTPGIYVGTEEEVDDGVSFEEKITGLKAKLNEQFVKSTDLQKKIQKNLEEF